jgi:hypothetical protein
MKIFNKKDKIKNKDINDDSQKIESINSIDLDNIEKKLDENTNNTHDFDKVIEENNQRKIEESLAELNNDAPDILKDVLIEAKIDLLPANLVIGYYEGMTMKGLKEYINGYVFKYFNAPNITSYKILKYNSGLIFEIHDGDYKKSYLNTVINEFNNGRHVVYIKTQNRIAKVIKNYSKIETYMLPESENNHHPDAIFPEKATMKPIVTTAFGMIPFGLSIAFMGVTSLFLSYIFKTILGKDEEVSLPTYTMELPSSYIEKLPLATETKYVDKVLYTKNSWTKEFKEIKTPKMIQAEKMDFALSKILAYQNFTNKCFTKSHSLEQCNDSNIFFDKADFSNDSFIKNVSMEKGLITVLLKDNESIKYIPEVNENNLLWKIECSSADLASLCLAPNVVIKNNKKSVLIDEFPKVVPSIEKEAVKDKPSDSKKVLETKLPLKSSENKVSKEKEIIKPIIIKKVEDEKPKNVHEIIKDVKSNDILKTPKIDEVNKTLQKIEDSAKPLDNLNNVEKSLNFNNLPDNVVVEKK